MSSLSALPNDVCVRPILRSTSSSLTAFCSSSRLRRFSTPRLPLVTLQLLNTMRASRSLSTRSQCEALWIRHFLFRWSIRKLQGSRFRSWRLSYLSCDRDELSEWSHWSLSALKSVESLAGCPWPATSRSSSS